MKKTQKQETDARSKFGRPSYGSPQSAILVTWGPKLDRPPAEMEKPKWPLGKRKK
jgi:hypothetical protein